MINVLQTRLLRLRAAQTLWHKVNIYLSDDKFHAVTKKLLWIKNKICDQQFDRCVQNLTSIRFL